LKIYFDEHRYHSSRYLKNQKRYLLLIIISPFIIFIISYFVLVISNPVAPPLEPLIISLVFVLLPGFLAFMSLYVLETWSGKKTWRYITDEHIFGAPVKDVVKILVVRRDEWRVHGYDIYVIHRRAHKNKEKLDFKRNYFHDAYDGKVMFRKFMEALERLKEDTGIDIPVEFMRDYEFKGWRKHV